MKRMLTLSDTEEKVLAMLRKQHEGWKTTRAIILLVNLVILAMSGWLYYSNNILAAGVLLAFAGYGFSYVLAGWHGRPEISLLFRLVEHAKSEREV